MKPAMLFAAAVVASVLAAGELDDKLVRLIGPDMKFVYAVDLDRARSSTLSEIFPMGMGGYFALPSAESKIHGFVKVETAQPNGSGSLLILRGALSPSDFQPDTAQTTVAALVYKGIPLWPIGHSSGVAMIDTNTVVIGEPDAVTEALDRWLQKTAHTGAIGSALAELSRSYDNWFFVPTPFLEETGVRPRTDSIYGGELIHAVESLQGGIRFGGSTEIHLQATTKSAEDALSAAAIARWLPGFWQLQNHEDLESAVLDLAEDMNVRADGGIASLSFRISEQRLRELADLTRARTQATRK